MSVVLMYHSLYRGNDTSDIDAVDLPYAVSEENFVKQLDLIAKKTSGIYEQAEKPDVVITFDDGHRSNLEIAVPLLQARELSAYFFVTTGFTNTRSGFMSSAELKTLASEPGMLVGSHGVTHKFFNDLTAEEGRSELSNSKAFIEDVTKHPCESMSFPGGRYNERTLKYLEESGYKQWFGSDVGLVDDTRSFRPELVEGSECYLMSMTGRQPLSRVAIRRTTELDEFELMINSDSAYFRSQVLRSQAKKLLQKTLGNRLYYGLYKSVSER